jgi:hypothetical protein
MIMKIHVSNSVTPEILRKAAEVANVGMTFGECDSRSADHAFDILLTGHSKYRNMSNTGMSATWDQWGVFLAYLFSQDEDMICGTVKRPTYNGFGDFNWQTDYRFARYGFPEDAHGDHKWIVGEPYRQTCKHCSAVKRWQR